MQSRPGYNTDDPTTINCKIHSGTVRGPLHQHKETRCANISICHEKTNQCCAPLLSQAFATCSVAESQYLYLSKSSVDLIGSFPEVRILEFGSI